MTTQLDIFDDSWTAREDAIQRAEDHADEEWKRAAYDAVILTARLRPTFTADDVWERIGDSSTHEPSALGPVFLRASRAGLIVKTGYMRPSRNARRHRDLVVWRAK